MKNRIITILALAMMLGVTSCHEEADVQMNYSQNDKVSFLEAYDSYAGKFRVLWNAININYGLWDYEADCGVDWDDVYKEMLPKFQELDSLDQVPDTLLQRLLNEMIEPLHDGHMTVTVINHKTNTPVIVSPSALRNVQRADVEEVRSFETSLKAYAENKELSDYKAETTMAIDLFYSMNYTEGIGFQWAKAKAEELSVKSDLTAKEATTLVGLKGFLAEMTSIQNYVKQGGINKEIIDAYNNVVLKYTYLNIPFLESIDPEFVDSGVRVTFGQFNDGIVYFSTNHFRLSAYLDSSFFNEKFGSADTHTLAQADMIKTVWSSWFNAIQRLYKAGKLKGVIVDVRNNGGGYQSDTRYLLGCLQPAGGFQIGYSRFKRGLGRYDYSPMMPNIMLTMDEDHVIVNDVPVVVLTNLNSVSMSEMTALTCKQMPNGCVIGRRSWGGVCGLTGNDSFSTDYAGKIGIEGVTPVAVYLPTQCNFDMDKKSMEGIGVEPDIEVAYDRKKFTSTGYDSQLDRALEYIRSKN